MGAGGNMNVKNSNQNDNTDFLKRVPVEKPKFTLADLKKAIPPHCFRRSILRSYAYVVTDLTLISIFYYLATTFIPHLPPPLHPLAWAAYWAVQGCVFTGVWVLAHECGHHAFTDYQWLDDVTGLILHSTLLVPYFSWKYSHRRHHSNTGSIERDEVFVPKPKSKISPLSKYLSNNPLGRLFTVAFTLTLGWPLYLTFNVSGRPYDRFACHYDPYGPIYNHRERLQILISDIGLVAAIYALYRVAMLKGFAWLFCIYGVPLLICNGFLVLITYLQHTHPALPHYNGSEWDWLRGALATVDRDYGILNNVFHNITDTHVVHHLFSTMPHYHAKEATVAVRPILGEYYRLDETPFWNAIWREAKECIYVEADEGSEKNGVLWYKNKF